MRNVVFVLVMMAAMTAAAQDAAIKEEIELTRAVIQTERQALVSAAMQLTAAEADAFWPLYREYRGQVAVLGDREVKLITDYADNVDVMTDYKAQQMLDEYLDIETQHLKLRKKYLKKFRKILPEIKVTRFYQLENKLNAVIDNELAAQIPLVE